MESTHSQTRAVAFIADERGQSTLEYAFLLLLIVAIAAVALSLLGVRITNLIRPLPLSLQE